MDQDHVGLTGFELVDEDVGQGVVLLLLLLELVEFCTGYVVGLTGVSLVVEEDVGHDVLLLDVIVELYTG